MLDSLPLHSNNDFSSTHLFRKQLSWLRVATMSHNTSLPIHIPYALRFLPYLHPSPLCHSPFPVGSATYQWCHDSGAVKSCEKWWGTSSREKRERAAHLFKWPPSPSHTSLTPDQWSRCYNWTCTDVWAHTHGIYFWIHGQILGHIEGAAVTSVLLKGTSLWRT